MRITPAAYKLEKSITGQQMCFGIICINFATQMENVTFSIIFSQKYAKIPIPRMQKNFNGQ